MAEWRDFKLYLLHLKGLWCIILYTTRQSVFNEKLKCREQGNKNYNIMFPCTIICQTREHNKPDFYVT